MLPSAVSGDLRVVPAFAMAFRFAVTAPGLLVAMIRWMAS